MSTRRAIQTSAAPSPPQPSTNSPFYQQRDTLVTEIALSLEQVLVNINKLNRSLEGVIAVGNEFGAVEALWSQFEGVMAQGGEQKEGKEGETDGEKGEEDGDRDRDRDGDEESEEEGQVVEGRERARSRG
ncbi:MAG: hypothetical protein Q9217_003482 [Psora testacea]